MSLKKLVGVVDFHKLETLNEDELRLLRRTIDTQIDKFRDNKISNMKSQISEGMNVTVNHKKLTGIMCEVVKVNRKRIVISCSKGRFTVPMNMINIVS